MEDLDKFNEELEEDSGHEFARIFGTEHPWFWRIHVTALVSLGKKNQERLSSLGVPECSGHFGILGTISKKCKNVKYRIFFFQ